MSREHSLESHALCLHPPIPRKIAELELYSAAHRYSFQPKDKDP